MNMRKYDLYIIFSGIFFFFFNIFCTGHIYAQNAVITEEQKTIKTYPFGDPSPVPILAQGRKRIYPYFKFDGYSRVGKDQQWKVVTLENEYIKVFILPEVGGKVWGAIEKSTGKEFLYQNDVMKFRNIALRGPWTSGGIEFNFGIQGHTPATGTPVDYLIRENDDGSVSCVVGTTDLPSGTRWRVTITLPKDKAYFETESLWYNPSHLDQSYYVWMNAAIKAADDLQFFFPGSHYIGHSGDAHPWPVDNQGRDLSYYKNNNFGPSKSYHVLGKRTEFFGGYWHDEDFGFGHWSQHHDMPGKKIWIWSLARSGAIWEDLLTDTDGQYVEVQSGRLFSQAASASNKTPFDQTALQAAATDHWKELWFPVKETGGLSAASQHAVLNLDQIGESLILKLMALQNIDDELAIYSGEEVIERKTISLKPLEVYYDTVALSGNTSQPSVILKDRKLVFSNNKDGRLVRPMETRRDDNQGPTADQLYREARNHAKSRRYGRAMDTYATSLEKDDSFIPAYTGLAELYYRRGEFAQAARHSAQALSYDTYHDAANYMYGLAKFKTGKDEQALEALGWAARSNKYRSAAYSAMAEIYLKRHNFDSAVEYADRALNFNATNIKALQLQAVGYRKLDKKDAAQTVLDEILKIDPLNHFARFEQYMLEADVEKLNQFTSLIRNELPHETYLDLAAFYNSINFNDAAVNVLKQAPANPIVYYWLAYLQRVSEESESSQYLNRAVSRSPNLVYPFRLESIPVLKWARKQNDSWKTDYYLGLIHWHNDRKKEAEQLFTELREVPDYAPFYLTRGKLLQELDYPDEQVLKDYQRAHQLDKNEWRTWHALTQFYMQSGTVEEALATSHKAHGMFVDNDAIEMDYAKSLLLNGKYEECVALLEQTHILPFEGAREGHDIFEQANIFEALKRMKKGDLKTALQYVNNARNWPESLGVGKPYNPDVRLQNYIEASIQKQLGKTNRAEELFAEIYDYTQKYHTSWGPGHYIGIVVSKKLGFDKQAEKLLTDWKDAQPRSRLAQWSVDHFNGNTGNNRSESQLDEGKSKSVDSFLLLTETVYTAQ